MMLKFKQKMWSEMDLNRAQGITSYKYSSPNRKRFLCEAWWLRTHTAWDSPPRQPWASQPLQWCRDKRRWYGESICTLRKCELFLWRSLPVMMLCLRQSVPSQDVSNQMPNDLTTYTVRIQDSVWAQLNGPSQLFKSRDFRTLEHYRDQR